MSEFLKAVKNTNKAVAVYYKAGGAFCAGIVKESDEEFVCMQFITPSGRFDGWHCIRIEEILKMDFSTNYLANLEKVYRHLGEDTREIKLSPKNVLDSFLDLAIKNKWLCTFEIGFDTLEKISGYIVQREWSAVQVKLVDENGLPDGYTTFETEDIVYAGVQSEFEEYLTVLGTINGNVGGDDPAPKKKEKKADEVDVLAFPRKK